MSSDTHSRELYRREPHVLPFGWNWEWQDRIFSFEGGAQPPASQFMDRSAPGNVRFVQIRDYYSVDHLTYVPDLPGLRKCTAQDVMIARYGASLGRICRGVPGAYNVALVKAIPLECVENDFLFYLLQTEYFQAPMQGQGARSAQAGFNREGLKNILLPLPSREEQRAIASVLQALDEKIAANSRTVSTADELARMLTRSSLDLDAPQALSRGAEVTMGSSPPGTSYNEMGQGTVFYQGVRDFGIRYPSPRVWTTAPVRYAEAQDCLVSVRAPVGELNLAAEKTCIGRGIASVGELNLAAEKTCIGRGIASVRSTSGTPMTLFHLLRDAPEVWAPYEAEGTIFGSINRNQMESLPVPTIRSDRVRSLEVELAAVEGSIAGLLAESSTLGMTRDTFLPRLLSGRLRVKCAEERVEAVV